LIEDLKLIIATGLRAGIAQMNADN